MIEKIIAKAANVSIEEIHGRKRTQALVDARQAIWYIAYTQLAFSYPKIGVLYDRDHTTIMHGVKSFHDAGLGDEIIEKVRKASPTVFDTPLEGEERTVKYWKF